MHITVDGGRWYVSFSTDDGEPEYDDAEIAAWLGRFEGDELRERSVGVDRESYPDCRERLGCLLPYYSRAA
jgi:putative transposase